MPRFDIIEMDVFFALDSRTIFNVLKEEPYELLPQQDWMYRECDLHFVWNVSFTH